MGIRKCGICGRADHDARKCPLAPIGTLNSGAIVRHSGGNIAWHCSCEGGWIAHWRNHSGSKRKTCSVEGCVSDATDGAHILEGATRIQKLIPMCARHNRGWDQKRYDELTVNQINWVNANPKVTRCKR